MKVNIGAHVMLTNNLNVADGLTNGATGTVTKVITNNHTNENKRLQCILVKFDSPMVRKNAIANSAYKNICRKSVPIKKIQVPFPVKKKIFKGQDLDSHYSFLGQ